MSLFIALSVPEVARKALRTALVRCESSIEHVIAEERWHITLVWLGKSEADQDMSALLHDIALPFVPAVTVTHMGRGLQAQQLWAYAAPTYPLQALQTMIVKRVQDSGLIWPQADFEREFTPYIYLADFTATAMPKMIPDETVQVTFVPKEAILYASLRDGETIYYKQQGVIKLQA